MILVYKPVKVRAFSGFFIVATICYLYFMANFDIAVQLTGLSYRKLWNKNRLDSFQDQEIANCVYGCSISNGAVIAAKILQEVLDQPQDGIISVDTIGDVNTSDDYSVICELYKLKIKDYEIYHR